jgi:hypothetical protein
MLAKLIEALLIKETAEKDLLKEIADGFEKAYIDLTNRPYNKEDFSSYKKIAEELRTIAWKC